MATHVINLSECYTNTPCPLGAHVYNYGPQQMFMKAHDKSGVETRQSSLRSTIDLDGLRASLHKDTNVYNASNRVQHGRYIRLLFQRSIRTNTIPNQTKPVNRHQPNPDITQPSPPQQDSSPFDQASALDPNYPSPIPLPRRAPPHRLRLEEPHAQPSFPSRETTATIPHRRPP